jgi:threonylcarbamoyladenosine tRNA methylthiotransferase MtaB
MKVAFHTLGCKVNQNDTDSLVRIFQERDYTIAPFGPGADIYIINTCTVTKLGEHKSRQIINKAVSYQPQLVVVTGCYPQVAPEEVAAIPGVDLIVGMAERPRIVELVEKLLVQPQKIVQVGKIADLQAWVNLPVGLAGERTRANLKIEEGCDQFCTYCIIPYARGKVRSMPLAQVIAEFKSLLRAGFKEVVVSGIHLGAYGKDIGVTLNEALSAILQIDGEFRIRLGSLEPTDFTAELIATIINHPKVCQYLHIPLQSGCDRILKMMNRNYNLAYYTELMENLRKNNPRLAIGTDLIVGFPGETEADFDSSCTFVTEMAFSRIHVFRYSPRKGTPAAGLPGRVSRAIQEGRSKLISGIGKETGANYTRQFLGETVAVLFEECADDRWMGLTGEYLRAEVESKRDLKNILARVTITEMAGNNLIGKIID